MGKNEKSLKADGQILDIKPETFKEIIKSSSDIGIVIDLTGLIHEIYVNLRGSNSKSFDQWRTKNINDFLTIESQEKVLAILAKLSNGDAKVDRAIELNHYDKCDGFEIPVSYAVNRLDNDDKLLLIGRDLRAISEIQQQLVSAQLSLEKEFERYRSYDTRYRVILETSTEGIIFVNSVTGRISDTNTIAAHILGADNTRLMNSNFASLFTAEDHEKFIQNLRSTAIQPSSASIKVTIKNSAKEVMIEPTIFRANTDVLILCKIKQYLKNLHTYDEVNESLRALYESGPDGVIFTDSNGIIRYSNESFMALCDIMNVNELKGKSFANFLAKGSIDLKVLLNNITEHNKIQLYATKLQTKFGMQLPIHISSSHLTKDKSSLIGFVIRDVSRLETGKSGNDAVSKQALENIMKLVGSAPLKELVADTSDVVERLCIETAIKLTKNNRVAAAEMLGVSRQSLYVKLRKYDLMS